MLERFFPQIYVKSIFELPLEDLKNRGIKAIYFDIDNTIAPYDQPEPDPESLAFLRELMARGFHVGLLSNNHGERIRVFNRRLGAEAVSDAGKPGFAKLKESMKRLGVTEAETALVGDQAFTDVYCANRAGVLSVLTAPVCGRDQWITKVKRPLEKPVLKAYFKRSGQNGHYH